MRPVQWITIALALCFSALAGPFAALASMEPRAGAPVIVVAPYGKIDVAIRSVDAAGGRVIGPQTGLIGVMAFSRTDGFAHQLKAHGAWLVLDATAIAQLCGISTDEYA